MRGEDRDARAAELLSGALGCGPFCALVFDTFSVPPFPSRLFGLSYNKDSYMVSDPTARVRCSDVCLCCVLVLILGVIGGGAAIAAGVSRWLNSRSV